MNAADIDPVVCRPVGIVRSRFTETSGMPIQTAGAPDEVGRLEVFAEFAPGLRDIEGFDYLILVTHLHRCAHERLEVVPFLDDATHGVFATRAPARPNRLGLSIVRLTAVEGTTLHFSGNDMIDGTPVLDIKPYVPRFDVRETERVGWFGARLDQLPRTRSDGLMD
ncbi:tRNA (N6-threonylcarbamoyladenosine(37)-N6)-methyltransferase TrmO [Variovorax sp. KBS0712]|uniref:tRNA (N6-threonylcarbamoyladenosine(37)-N6)-methyltransferase TrmO n=1 Tax=Variovorax sp. KBS0712 TaxID=2578111 RepID=UPI00111857D8|nr:tRNA (N6-threonylcarbamoyladenosine(37)-N6)-methyltransferase TrmO [Variovorax sp. KBS0712]TSD61651.1 tRNA (N6-threonylcarbamoyladenosine(37)-N6)-methyltransferase TrmO [Variovorax sp. KBS0712]